MSSTDIVQVVTPDTVATYVHALEKALQKEEQATSGIQQLQAMRSMKGGGIGMSALKTLGGLAFSSVEKMFYSITSTYMSCLLSALILPLVVPGSYLGFEFSLCNSLFMSMINTSYLLTRTALQYTFPIFYNGPSFALFVLLFKGITYVPGVMTVTKQYQSCCKAWINFMAIVFARAGISVIDLIKRLRQNSAEKDVVQQEIQGHVIKALEASKMDEKNGEELKLDAMELKMAEENEALLMRLVQKQLLKKPAFMLKVLNEKKEELAEEKVEVKEEIQELQNATPPPPLPTTVSKVKTKRRRAAARRKTLALLI